MRPTLLLFVFLFYGFICQAQLPYETPNYSLPIHVAVFKYGNTEDNYLKFYAPANTTSKPLLVIVPGSGFESSEGLTILNFFNDEALAFAQRGYAVIIVKHYTVAPGSSCNNFGDIVGKAASDIHAAIQYTLVNGGLFNINANYIYIYGQSAGGIAATAAVWLDDAKFAQEFGISKNRSAITSRDYYIRAMALESSAVYKLDYFNASNRNVTIPLLFFHGDGDNVVPYHSNPSSKCPNVTLHGPFTIATSIYYSPVGNPRKGICYQVNSYQTSAHHLVNKKSAMQAKTANFFARNIWNLSCSAELNSYSYNRLGEEAEQHTEAATAQTVEWSNDQLVFNLNNSGQANFLLYDISGSLKKEGTVSDASAISTHDLVNGIYIVLVETEVGTIKQKIVVQR